jgi:hypothetical protein
VAFQIQRYVVAVFSFIFMVYFAQDILMLFLEQFWVCLGISFLFSALVLVFDYFLPFAMDAWFLNDVVAIMVAGGFVKYVIIKKLSGSILAIVLYWIFCVIR